MLDSMSGAGISPQLVRFSTKRTMRKLASSTTKMKPPTSPPMHTRSTRLQTVSITLNGQTRKTRVVMSGFGSALSLVLRIMKALAAPQESDITDMQREMSWLFEYCPVLVTMTTW